MRAVRFHAPGEPLHVEEVPLPEPIGSQVRLRVAGCGVCHTDLHIVDGRQSRVTPPITLGHEVAGWIDAAGPDAGGALAAAGLRDGDAVLVFGGWGCGSCIACLVGEEQRCPDGASPGFQRDGGYAEAILVPDARHLVPVGGLDPVEAAPLADAGVTPYRAVRRIAPWLTNTNAPVLVIGCGALGAFALQHLRRLPRGADLRISVAEADPRRAARATALGADAALIEPDADAVRAALGGPADAVLDLVGTDATLELAAAAVAPGGVVMLVGEAGGELPFGFERQPIETWLTTSAWGSYAELASVVGAAAGGDLRWNVERMPLADAPRALDRLREGAVDGRIVLVP